MAALEVVSHKDRPMFPFGRREFLQSSAALAALSTAGNLFAKEPADSGVDFAFGLVTYMWGADWDLPTLIENCKKTGLRGVELRTTHAHKVEPILSAKERDEVRARFTDSGVTLVGLGSNEKFDYVDGAMLRKAIDASKDFLRLSHDIGATGVKVKPDSFPAGVSHDQTIAQIGKSLHELGEFAEGLGQQVRLEVHGSCQELPTIEAIMKAADHSSVVVCWNSNPTDLKGDGLEKNFARVKAKFGDTLHVHELESKDYPYDQLFRLLAAAKYTGWMLLEAATKPVDRIAAMKEQKALFDKLVDGTVKQQ